MLSVKDATILNHGKALGIELQNEIHRSALLPHVFGTEASRKLAEKGKSSPIFYSLTLLFGRTWSKVDVDMQNSLSLAGTIIHIDEIIESNPLTLINPDILIDNSINSFPVKDSVLVRETLSTMVRSMFMERCLKDETQLNGQELISAGDVPYDYESYKNVVANSFGMMPIFAAVSEETNEQELFITDFVFNQLKALEACSRLLADDITVKKDIDNGDLNLVTYYMSEFGCDINKAQDAIRSEALELIQSVKDAYPQKNYPKVVRFALSFVDVLCNVDNISSEHKSALLKKFGEKIREQPSF